jgi:putative MATE family efflux protein
MKPQTETEELLPESPQEQPKINIKVKTDLLNGEIHSTLRKFSAPLALSFLVNMIYSWIDMYFVSRMGDKAIVALGVSDQFGFFIFTLGSGFAVGTGIVVARRIGERNIDDANKTATQALVGMLTISTLLMGIVLLTSSFILPKLGASGLSLDYALAYITFLALGIPANLTTFQINNTIRSTGNSIFPMMVLLMTSAVNLLFAPILIFGWGFQGFGIAGAGMATALAQWAGLIFSFWYLNTGKLQVRLDFNNFKIKLDTQWLIAKIGFPGSLQMLSVSLTRIGLYSIVAKFGESVLAAYTLGLRVDFIVFMIVFAVGVAMEIITGQHLGAQKVKRIFEYHRSAMLQLGSLMVFLGAIVYMFGVNLVSIFTKDPVTISESVSYLHVLVFGYLAFSIAVVSMRILSGAGSTVKSLIVVGSSHIFVMLPLCYFFAFYTPYKQYGVWYGIVISYVLMMIFSLVEVYRGKWITKKV